MTRKQPLLWVTRSSPFNLLTAHRLRAMGHGVLLAPLFEIRPLEAPEIAGRPDLIAFTSVNGVRHHGYRAAWADVPVFAVGNTTAAAARRCGYRNVRSANGDLRDLQALILRSCSTGLRLFHFSAREAAGDLAGYLRCRGFDAVRCRVYETVPRTMREGRDMLLDVSRADAILVHSPMGARRVAELIAEIGWVGTLFCISKACAKEFEGLSGLSVKSAPRPTERALMDMIRKATEARAARHAAAESGESKFLRKIEDSGRLLGANDNSWLAPEPA